MIFVRINLWNIRKEDGFLELFANKVLKASSNKFTETIESAKSFLDRLKPTIKLEYEEISFEVGINWKMDGVKDILDLPQRIAEKKKKKLVICMDEFQDIEYFEDSISFQKRLRSHWQQHNDVSYVIYGSKRHMLINMFNDSSMPFFRFGDLLVLKKIEQEKLVDFIVGSFSSTNKTILNEDARLITKALDRHPYYIQQLCNILWQNTDKEVTGLLLSESTDEFLEYNSGQFEILVRNLSDTQLNFLVALAHDEIAFHSQPVLTKYKLGSSANVTSIKRMLIEKEIIEEEGGIYKFSDPVFEIYFKRQYRIKPTI